MLSFALNDWDEITVEDVYVRRLTHWDYRRTCG